MKTRDVAKVIVIVGWAAGIVLILAAVPFLLALAAFALTVASAVAVDRRGTAGMAWVKARASRVLERRIKTGRAVERA
jgi:uncharacterized membrane protein